MKMYLKSIISLTIVLFSGISFASEQIVIQEEISIKETLQTVYQDYYETTSVANSIIVKAVNNNGLLLAQVADNSTTPGTNVLDGLSVLWDVNNGQLVAASTDFIATVNNNYYYTIAEDVNANFGFICPIATLQYNATTKELSNPQCYQRQLTTLGASGLLGIVSGIIVSANMGVFTNNSGWSYGYTDNSDVVMQSPIQTFNLGFKNSIASSCIEITVGGQPVDVSIFFSYITQETQPAAVLGTCNNEGIVIFEFNTVSQAYEGRLINIPETEQPVSGLLESGTPLPDTVGDKLVFSSPLSFFDPNAEIDIDTSTVGVVKITSTSLGSSLICDRADCAGSALESSEYSVKLHTSGIALRIPKSITIELTPEEYAAFEAGDTTVANEKLLEARSYSLALDNNPFAEGVLLPPQYNGNVLMSSSASGEYMVFAKSSEDAQGNDIDSISIVKLAVENAEPVTLNMTTQAGDPNANAFTFDLELQNFNPESEYTYEIDFGDGNTTTGSFVDGVASVTYQYTNNGSYNVAVSVIVNNEIIATQSQTVQPVYSGYTLRVLSFFWRIFGLI